MEAPNDQNEEASSTNNKSKINLDLGFTPSLSLGPYWFLVVLRIILTCIPQTGYIHPDEYFQSLEVLNEDIFNVAANRPWEFNSTFPIRSVALPYILVGIPLQLLKNVAPFVRLWFDFNPINPYTLLLVPRITCCLFSFINDYSLYKICNLYGQNYRARLLTLASSYVILVYGSRTFSNTIEMALTSFLVYLTANSMARSDYVIYQDEYLRECYNKSDNMKDRIRYHRIRISLPWHTFSSVLYIATVTVVGVFNRPTFLAFAFSPLFFWLQRGMGTRYIGMTDFHLRVAALGLCSIPALIFMTGFDSVYYGYLSFEEIKTMNISVWRDIVLTPYNFITYNIDAGNLSRHGIHPRFTHLLVNVPLLFNVLGISGLIGFSNLVYRGILKQWSTLPRVQSIIGLMTTSFIIPIVVLSIFPHQEPRFLIPCILPLVFLHSQKIRPVKEEKSLVTKEENGCRAFVKKDIKLEGKDSLLALWYMINIILTLFFGFIHQAGIYPLISYMHMKMEAKPRFTIVHVATSHIYPVPLSMLQIRNDKTVFYTQTGKRYQRIRDFYTYELGSENMENVIDKLNNLLETGEKTLTEKKLKYQVYYAVPGSLMNEFKDMAIRKNLTHEIESFFYPHFSSEAMPKFYGCQEGGFYSKNNVDYCEPEKEYFTTLDFPLKFLSELAHQLGLTLYRIRK